jgi:alanine dehydrogenase
MIIGVPKEIKVEEYRVGLTPDSVRECASQGHRVLVETACGAGIGYTDDHYRAAGAEVLEVDAVWGEADMIVKVKEPQKTEYAYLRADLVLFTYLHLAAEQALTEALVASGCTAIAYETVTDVHGRLPLLTPMSQVAGRLSIQCGAHCLEKPQGGSGILLSGVPGVSPGRVVVIGGGVVGSNAVRMAIGKQAHVTVLDKSLACLQRLDFEFGSLLDTVFASEANIERYVLEADLVVGAVLVPGGEAPRLIQKHMLSRMRPGSVFVDVAIDQGGCAETSRATTHTDPTYVVDGVVHYCVANMPGAVPLTSTQALNNATLPFVLALASQGPKAALAQDAHLRNGLNVCHGEVTYQAVAESFGYTFKEAASVL